jgi:hypothetical protein
LQYDRARRQKACICTFCLLSYAEGSSPDELFGVLPSFFNTNFSLGAAFGGEKKKIGGDTPHPARGDSPWTLLYEIVKKIGR